jgi:hypothetical protein
MPAPAATTDDPEIAMRAGLCTFRERACSATVEFSTAPRADATTACRVESTLEGRIHAGQERGLGAVHENVDVPAGEA